LARKPGVKLLVRRPRYENNNGISLEGNRMWRCELHPSGSGLAVLNTVTKYWWNKRGGIL
jgi:hypothetical protein